MLVMIPNFLATGIEAMLNMEMDIEHMEAIYLQRTKGEMSLQDQEVHWF